MCLAQGHNAVTPVRLKPAAPHSRVKHSTTEPRRSLKVMNENETNMILVKGGRHQQKVADTNKKQHGTYGVPDQLRQISYLSLCGSQM